MLIESKFLVRATHEANSSYALFTRLSKDSGHRTFSINDSFPLLDCQEPRPLREASDRGFLETYHIVVLSFFKGIYKRTMCEVVGFPA